MHTRLILIFIIVTAAITLIIGCGPRSSSAPGTACFGIYKIDPNIGRINDVATVKVREEVAVDISCADPCKYNRDINWGDGYWGEYLTHVYDTPGTYTVKYACSTHSERARSHSRKTRRYSHGQRYESAKIITVTQ